MGPANASSGRSVDGNLLEPDQKDLSSNVESLQLTTFSKINSRTNLNQIDETRGNITVEEGDLFVNKKIFGRKTHTHHTASSKILSIDPLLEK